IPFPAPVTIATRSARVIVVGAPFACAGTGDTPGGDRAAACIIDANVGSRRRRVREPWRPASARRNTRRVRRSATIMRIHSIEAIAVDIPLSKNFGGSTYAVLKRSTVITRMRTEGGLVSEVYNGDNREDGPAIVRLIHEMEAYREAGMAGCKFKVGGLAPDEDARRVEAARRAAGPDFVLAVDANRGWSAQDAIRFARLVEPLDIRWFEEPCHWYDDVALMARVRHATRIPVTAGQSEITSHGVRRMLDARAVDFVNLDASA